jgi:hypothetical protein
VRKPVSQNVNNTCLVTDGKAAVYWRAILLQEGRTALMWAAMNGHTEVVKALIEKGADVNAMEKVRRRHYSVSTGEGMTD